VLPAFAATNPGFKVKYLPTKSIDYDVNVPENLESGVPSDIVACRPFDWSLGLFSRNLITDVTSVVDRDTMSPIGIDAFSTDDGATTFCIPMASVLHGTYYNKTLFKELGLAIPTTVDEFVAELSKIAQDGRYTPIAAGAAEAGEIATTLVSVFGPVYWNGEKGRNAIIDGTAKFTDPEYVDALRLLDRLRPFYPPAVADFEYVDMKRLFTNGEAVFFPGGSWEITTMTADAKFEIGLLPPLRLSADGPCFITDHPDIGIGVSARSTHPKEARAFAEWAATPALYDGYSSKLEGFFPLMSGAKESSNALMREFAKYREECQRTPRFPDQYLSRSTPVFRTELWRLSTEVVVGHVTPEQAAVELQAVLDATYTPVRR
jgi:raffinose/stachyose/melibiose transport system substrate-binding protein